MARTPDELGGDRFLRALLLGKPKSGKTTMTVVTLPKPVRVILCEDDSALAPAKRETRDFTFARVNTHDDMLSALLEARRDAKKETIASVVLDPLSVYATKILENAFDSTRTRNGEDNGLAAYSRVDRQLNHALDQLLDIPAHVVAISHYITKGDDDTKVGDGLLPVMPTQKLAQMVPSKFKDVVWFHYDAKTGRRVLKVNPVGVFGPAGRTFREAREIEADIYSDAKRVGWARFLSEMRKERERIAAEDAAREATKNK
jgi:hypothetical protein